MNCFQLSYLATLLRSCTSLPVTIQSEHYCAFIIRAKQLAVNFFLYSRMGLLSEASSAQTYAVVCLYGVSE